MRAPVPLLCLFLFFVSAPAAELNPQPTASPILDPEKEGIELAARLRTTAPAENSETAGALRITSREGQVRHIPITSKITVGNTNWQVVYQTSATDTAPAETLTITHTPGQPNRLQLMIGTNSTAVTNLARPFAGSDFCLMDLGLEFFHWPQQRAIRSEMSRGQPCRVLESVLPNPAADGYARVLSWVDLESGGVIQAEAYDRKNKLLKKFEIGSFKKIDGRWHLRDLRIRTSRTGQKTELKFEFKTR